MTTNRIIRSAALTFAALAASVQLAVAQVAVTQADIQRLQDQINDVSEEVAQVRGRDASLAEDLETELDEARDETIYLRVKLRKNEPVTRADYADLRDRIDDIRFRARDGNAPAAAAPSSAPASQPASTTAAAADVPVGTELDVRLQTALSSDTAQVEDRFEATTVVDLIRGERVIVPAGSVLRGVVSSVDSAGRLERRGSLTLAFDRITIRGQDYPFRATVTQAIESEGVRGEAGRIGAGAGVGAIIGGILGGFRGALAGILIGGGGTIAATEGEDVELEPGTVLRIRVDSPITLRAQ
ncbi:MAG: hypothetical protein AB7F99_00390 [Vicinamibacterales bacterium]